MNDIAQGEIARGIAPCIGCLIGFPIASSLSRIEQFQFPTDIAICKHRKGRPSIEAGYIAKILPLVEEATRKGG